MTIYQKSTGIRFGKFILIDCKTIGDQAPVTLQCAKVCKMFGYEQTLNENVQKCAELVQKCEELVQKCVELVQKCVELVKNVQECAIVCATYCANRLI